MSKSALYNTLLGLPYQKPLTYPTIDRIVNSNAEAKDQTMKPKIYVACLAAYNNGVLHGRWIDADQDADAINEEIQAILASSPISGAEEFAIHDFEDFGSYRVDEYDSVELVSAIARALSEHGDAMSAWLSNDMPQTVEQAEERIERFNEAYLGEWDSLEHYADDYLEEIGAHKALQMFGPSVRIDVAGFARDLELGGDVFTADAAGGSVYVFNSNA